MPFLEKDDFITIISVAALDNLTDGNDAIIETMIIEGILEMMSYMEARYELAELFDDGGFPHPTIQMYCKDIVVYHLHSRKHLRGMPNIRQTRYEKALQWCRDVQAQKVNPFAYLNLDVDTKPLVKTGGNTKRENHQE